MFSVADVRPSSKALQSALTGKVYSLLDSQACATVRGMIEPVTPLSLAMSYHKALPERILNYLINERGISHAEIDFSMLGWNGQRITIPVWDREGRLKFFKIAKDPADESES